MIRSLLLGLGATLVISNSFAQLDQACISLSGGWNENSIGGAVEMNGGGFAVVGLYKASSTSPYRALVTKLDANGAVLWRYEYSFGTTLNTWAWAAVATTDGGLAVAGDTWSNWDATGRNAYILKLDADGNVVWAKAYMHPSYAVHVDGNSAGLIQTSDGGFALTGQHTDGPPGPFDNLMLRTDDQGNVLWSDDFWYTGTPAEVAEMEDGDLVFTGWSRQSLGPQITVRKDGITGVTVWRHWYTVPGTEQFDATCVVAGPDNSAVIGGYVIGAALNPASQPCVIAIDSMGDPLWMTRVAFSRRGYGYDMARHPSGGYVMSGRLNGLTNYEDSMGFVLRIDDIGSLEWAEWTQHQGAPMNRFKRCSIASDGDILLAGELYYQHQLFEKIAPDGTSCPNCPMNVEGTAYGDTAAIAPDQILSMLGSWATAYDLTSLAVRSSLPATIVGSACGSSTVEEATDDTGLRIHPNPCADRFTLSLSDGSADTDFVIELRDALGSLVHRMSAKSTSMVVDLSDVDPGMYFISLNSAGQIRTLRVVKE